MEKCTAARLNLTASEQRKVAQAIKRARHMALLPSSATPDRAAETHELNRKDRVGSAEIVVAL